MASAACFSSLGARAPGPPQEGCNTDKHPHTYIDVQLYLLICIYTYIYFFLYTCQSSCLFVEHYLLSSLPLHATQIICKPPPHKSGMVDSSFSQLWHSLEVSLLVDSVVHWYCWHRLLMVFPRWQCFCGELCCMHGIPSMAVLLWRTMLHAWYSLEGNFAVETYAAWYSLDGNVAVENYAAWYSLDGNVAVENYAAWYSLDGNFACF